MAYTGPSSRNHFSRVALHIANEKSIVIVHRAEMSPNYPSVIPVGNKAEEILLIVRHFITQMVISRYHLILMLTGTKYNSKALPPPSRTRVLLSFQLLQIVGYKFGVFPDSSLAVIRLPGGISVFYVADGMLHELHQG